MRVLVTGAAGYIGSVVVAELLEAGHQVVALDSLERGHRQAVSPGATLEVVELSHGEALEGVFQRHRPEAALHLAGYIEAGVSMQDPAPFFRNNVASALGLLEAMARHGCPRFVFASSAAVYGEPQALPLGEDHPLVPTSAYGETKLALERALPWFQRAYGLKHISLRFFNAAGATLRLGEDHRPETHLIPLALEAALGLREGLVIYGDRYPTPDGTCLRDYIHVSDLARGFLAALEAPEARWGRAYNLGTGQGHSVRQVAEAVRRISGREFPLKVAGPRPGDPEALVASPERAWRELGWRPRRSSLEEMVESAWRWRREHPRGYEA